MPIVYFNFSGVNCTGYVAAVETALYQTGVDHFEYDTFDKIAKIVFDEKDTSFEKIENAIKELGFQMHIIDIIEE